MTLPLNCVRRTESLANHTSFRIGGPADLFAEPSTLEELVTLLRMAAASGLPVAVIGGGTNMLVADRGINGLVVRLGRGFRTVSMLESEPPPRPDPSASRGGQQARVRCGASVITQRLVWLACQHGWGEVESLAGLPGQVGGAVAMNAQDIGRFVESLTLVSLQGEVECVSREQLRFSYRYTALPAGVITDVTFRFPKVPAELAATGIRQTLRRRNETQEVRLPSAGCAFKNPNGISAGRLIDQAGLKGARIGDAQISMRHANFIVNVGQATCDDVVSLMEHVLRCVTRRFGVRLEPEVRLLGERWTLSGRA